MYEAGRGEEVESKSVPKGVENGSTFFELVETDAVEVVSETLLSKKSSFMKFAVVAFVDDAADDADFVDCVGVGVSIFNSLLEVKNES